MGLENDADLKKQQEEIRKEREKVEKLEREVRELARKQAQQEAERRRHGQK